MHSVDSFGPDAIPEALRLAHAALATSSDDSEAASFAAMTIALLGGSIETAHLGRVDEARDMIRQLLQAQPHARIDPAFVRRQNRNESTAESWIRTLQQAGLPD
jgi:hypothetical protein